LKKRDKSGEADTRGRRSEGRRQRTEDGGQTTEGGRRGKGAFFQWRCSESKKPIS
jgi:hypothetical protein